MPQFQAVEFGQSFERIVFRLPPQDHAAETEVRFAEVEQRFAQGVVLADGKGGLAFSR
jgi:hypothetical protein